MARTIRKYPHVKAEWISPFQVLRWWGYNFYLPMSDVIEDVGVKGSREAILVNPANANYVQTRSEYQTTVKEGPDAVPTLWIERRTGTLLLKAKNFKKTYADTTLETSNKWTEGTTEKSGSGGKYSWTAADTKDVWKEEPLSNFPKMNEDGTLATPVTRKYLHMFNTNDTEATRQIKSDFELNSGGSFCIVVGLPAKPVGSNSNKTSPQVEISFGSGQWTIKWIRGEKPQLLDHDKKFLDTIRISEDTTSDYDNAWSKDKIITHTFFVQPIFNSLVISNGIPRDEKKVTGEVVPGQTWMYRVPTLEASTNGIAVPQSSITVTTKGGECFFAYIPIEYETSGVLASDTQDIGYDIVGLQNVPNKYTPEKTSIVVATEAGSQDFSWTATLNRDSETTYSSNSFTFNTYNVTPVLFGIEFNTNPIFLPAIFSLPTIDSGDVLSLDLQETVQKRTGTLVLWNRGGKFKELHGTYPIKISIGVKTGPPRITDEVATGEPTTMYTRLVGFVTGIEFSRPDASQSTVTLRIEDRRIQLEEAIAVNLPIYDGYDHKNAILDLAQRGGYISSDIKIDADTNFPANLPSAGFMKEPLYMFNLGTKIWECMEKIREWSQWWLYCDENGFLKYANPGFSTVSNPLPVRKFKEVPSTVDSYDEIHRLGIEKPLKDIVNVTFVQGLDNKNGRIPRPVFSIQRDNLQDTTKKGFVPWNRFVIIQDVQLNTPNVVEFVARETHVRASRPRFFVSFDTWGQPDIYPLSTVEIEELDRETGLMEFGARNFRITSITHRLGGEGKDFTTSFEGEWIDPLYTYDPYWR